ncbi:carbamoyltransferase HypF, partial [Kaarinaea lacus]
MINESYQPAQARFYVLSGHVQGIGFRPFVYRIAHEYGIHGWVQNRVGQVAIHAEGNFDNLQAFHYKLLNRAPLHSHPVVEQSQVVDAKNYSSFTILASSEDDKEDIRMIPDLPLCEDCLREMNDQDDRRFRYPFINCTQCGPRYTLIRKLPYDRANTTMADFPMCAECEAEYRNPLDRRYHAEPVACPQCGPGLYFQQSDKLVTGNERSLRACVEALRAGKIVAVKGLGGYHLMVDACNDEAVDKLRQRKPRPHKPLAVMMNEHQLEQHVILNKEKRVLLENEVHPIVLTEKKQNSAMSELIAPQLSEVGIMQPYSPLHHLLLQEFDGPLVATSANISGEPVLTDNTEVVQRLKNVADAYLHHNRAIQRPADDAVYRIIYGKPRVIRLGRGSAPLEITLPVNIEKPMLAVGGHMKNTVALAWENRIVMSPHIGEMDTLRSQ